MAEEMFDVVNDDDVVIGQASRSEVHATGLQHRGIHVCLFMPDGRMLIQQRSRSRHAAPSSLDCSVSEHVKAGEDYPTAAQRGLQEELGLKNIAVEPIITFRMNYGPNDNEICRLYQARLDDPSAVHFDPVEVESVDYASMDELQQLLADGKRPFSRWFEQMLLWAAGKPTELRILSTHGALVPEKYRT
jgi:isopentenyl-diphosphate delta-isomerase type 1